MIHDGCWALAGFGEAHVKVNIAKVANKANVKRFRNVFIFLSQSERFHALFFLTMILSTTRRLSRHGNLTLNCDNNDKIFT
ncbi:hypothetical protein CCAX7_10170 [Capsulimonas corticalis]|uniref:Uncharacterized protein n=1 Tax=Capsulimonas corticalis TaxID=2219043 RepID=A0A402CUF5_9BACT|nr:hypothetical protein CCAX7_10170 [Capsulimonas corticalis]